MKGKVLFHICWSFSTGFCWYLNSNQQNLWFLHQTLSSEQPLDHSKFRILKYYCWRYWSWRKWKKAIEAAAIPSSGEFITTHIHIYIYILPKSTVSTNLNSNIIELKSETSKKLPVSSHGVVKKMLILLFMFRVGVLKKKLFFTCKGV